MMQTKTVSVSATPSVYVFRNVYPICFTTFIFSALISFHPTKTLRYSYAKNSKSAQSRPLENQPPAARHRRCNRGGRRIGAEGVCDVQVRRLPGDSQFLFWEGQHDSPGFISPMTTLCTFCLFWFI